MSPATTCDLEKGALMVLMWQLMPFPPTQMALIGHGTAQGQLLGVTLQEKGRVERRTEHLWHFFVFLCFCTQKYLSAVYLFFIFPSIPAHYIIVNLPKVQTTTHSQSRANTASLQWSSACLLDGTGEGYVEKKGEGEIDDNMERGLGEGREVVLRGEEGEMI